MVKSSNSATVCPRLQEKGDPLHTAPLPHFLHSGAQALARLYPGHSSPASFLTQSYNRQHLPAVTHLQEFGVLNAPAPRHSVAFQPAGWASAAPLCRHLTGRICSVIPFIPGCVNAVLTPGSLALPHVSNLYRNCREARQYRAKPKPNLLVGKSSH